MDEQSRQKTEFRDHQAELAGAPNGRAERFFTGEASRRGSAKDKEAKARRAFLNQLELLMQDPAYRALWQTTMNKMDDLQEKLNTAIDKTSLQIEHLETLLEDLEDKAPKLEDGTAVFLDANGNVRTADGRQPQSDALTASLLLDLQTSPSYEQYAGARDALHSARARQDNLADIQEEVNKDRAILTDPDNPPSADEVRDIAENVDEYISRIDNITEARSSFSAVADPRLDDLDLSLDLNFEGQSL